MTVPEPEFAAAAGGLRGTALLRNSLSSGSFPTTSGTRKPSVSTGDGVWPGLRGGCCAAVACGGGIAPGCASTTATFCVEFWEQAAGPSRTGSSKNQWERRMGQLKGKTTRNGKQKISFRRFKGTGCLWSLAPESLFWVFFP